jgi:hypothetical protein
VSGPVSAGRGHREVEEPWGLGEFEGGQDGLLADGGGGALGDVAVGGGQGDQVHTVQFVADVAPGVAGGVLDHPDQQQCEPAQLDVGADPVLAVVEHRPQAEGAQSQVRNIGMS